MINILMQYKSKYLENISVWFVSFILTIAFVNSIMNHVPSIGGFIADVVLSGIITFVLYYLKPARIFVVTLFVSIHGILMVSFIENISQFTRISIRNTMPLINYLEELLYKFKLETFYSDMTQTTIKSIKLNVNFMEGKQYVFFWLSLIVIIAMIVAHFVEKRISWVFLLLPGLYYIIGWFFFVHELEFNFGIYMIAIIIYRQFTIYEKLPLEDHKYYMHGFFSNAMTIIVVLSLSALIVQSVPVIKINTQIGAFMPKISGLRDEFPIIPKAKRHFASYENGELFSLATTMYSPNGSKLGGPIINRSTENVMRVRSDEGGLYLRGGVKNVYDGKRWSTEFVTYDLRSKINKSPDDIESDKVSIVTIYPDNIKTKTLFSPNTYTKSDWEDDFIYQNEDTMLFIINSIDTDFQPYSVYYDSDYIVTLTDKEKEPYLGIPEKGLTETIRIAEYVTLAAKSDHEKMQYLVNYLRDNFTYTLEPEAYNGSKDFVEKFLTEDKVGYCTYFASSLAVMGRSVGVPTRYVEGYLTDYSKNDEGFYEVGGDRAHAWVEAYIEGSGWKVFEATPSYNEPLGSLTLEKPVSEIGSTTGEDSSFGELDASLDDDVKTTDDIDENEDTALDNTDEEEVNLTTLIKKEEVSVIKKYGLWILAAITSLVLMVYLFMKRKKKTSREKILKMIYKMHKVSLKHRTEINSDWPKAVINQFLTTHLDMKLSDREALIIDATLYAPEYDQTKDLFIMERLYFRFLKDVLKFKGIFKYIIIKYL